MTNTDDTRNAPRRTGLAAAAVLAASCAAPLAGAETRGLFADDPITGDNVVDVTEMIRVADAIDRAVDAKD